VQYLREKSIKLGTHSSPSPLERAFVSAATLCNPLRRTLSQCFTQGPWRCRKQPAVEASVDRPFETASRFKARWLVGESCKHSQHSAESHFHFSTILDDLCQNTTISLTGRSGLQHPSLFIQCNMCKVLQEIMPTNLRHSFCCLQPRVHFACRRLLHVRWSRCHAVQS